MIQTLQALNEYYDFLTIEAGDEWSKIIITAHKENLVVEETGYKIEDILQQLLLTTVRLKA